MIELSSTCTCFVLKSSIFTLAQIAWFCRVTVLPSILQSVLVRWRALWSVFLIITLCPETVSLSVQFQLCVIEIFFQIGDFHFLEMWLFFPSVMSLLYGVLSTIFSRFLSDVCTRLIVMWFVQSMQQMCLQVLPWLQRARFEDFPILSRVLITDT